MFLPPFAALHLLWGGSGRPDFYAMEQREGFSNQTVIKMAARGGKRPGAGRKPNAVKRMLSTQASGLLSIEDEKRLWNQFLESEDENIALKAFLAWNDRVYGKPKQAVEHSGADGEPISLAIKFV